MSLVSVVLVDDHSVVRAGLKALIAGYPGLSVVGEEASEAAAIALVSARQPDVVITDIRLGEGSGVEVCRAVKAASPSTRVILLSAYWSDELVAEAFAAGADGYLLKHAETLDIAGAVAAVMAGRPAIDTELLPALIHSNRPGPQPFSERDRTLVGLVARGRTNQMIASEMHLSPHTVKEYVSRILVKLGASNRTELISIAAALGLIDLGHAAAIASPPSVHRNHPPIGG